jgi:hypothetical protein
MPLPFTRRGIDPDAADFCSRSGASDRAAVSAFVRGVKDLGLYQSMVCWPLRSTQNAGTGTTAYSLGGLGTFNGSLINGPSWGTSGITFANASSQYISLGGTQIIGGNSDYTVMGVAQLTNVAAINLALISLGNNRGGLPNVVSNGSTQGRYAAWNTSGVAFVTQLANGPTTSMFSQFIAGDAVGIKCFINSGTPFNTQVGDGRVNPSATTLPTIGGFNIGGTSYGNFFNGLIPAAAMWNVKLTDAQVASVLNLYKSTLGTGLGLP